MVKDNDITVHVDKRAPYIDNSNIKLVKGEKGGIFTPHVDEHSNLSWSNDAGLSNPPIRNIRGKDGSASITYISNAEIEFIMEG